MSQAIKPDDMNPAEQLAEEAQKIGGVDEVDVLTLEGDSLVSMWARAEVADEIREKAEELGLREGPSYSTEDGKEVYLPFETEGW